ncbi:ABC transporter substrate-binding protein [Marinomonas rhizomae]|uniref:NitT/TauT family transport system substrate-binding protein n=1 Tax=Marinomonas rhizomae TaxID=491948 RepID=A0A366IYJ1_9GAMM|nr:ABC transporter substrate-binding protein [Marinomonas rhizomae]RBP79074.1 NitT/TauT family transport system substrate-binding protein [Marinomonas rhizomae]RNF68553.1 ABC transporter substrate-binding protein [Marinomonas rhizomae]
MRLLITLTALLLGSWSSLVTAADKSLEIGYMPIIPISQAFIVLEGDTLDEAGVSEPKLFQFQNGPAIVQALLAGQLDVAYLGIGPAMVARAKGADIKVVASNIVEQISMVALGSLSSYFDKGDAKTAFARFKADNGRKAVISTFPRGSVPETVLQYWLQNQLGMSNDDIKQNIDIIYQGAAQVQQSLMTEAVDGAAILEPVVSIIRDRKSDAKVVASGSGMFPHQPGAVLVVRESLINEDPMLVKALVKAHIAATDELHNNPEKAVKSVKKYVGGGRLATKIVLNALKNSRNQFEANPNTIIDGTRTMHDFQASQGTLKVNVDLDALFDVRFYNDIVKE